MMRNILVTGAAGFIGSHLSELLVQNGYQVIGLDNLSCIILKPSKPLTLDSKSPPFGFLISGGEAKSLNEFLKSELKEDQVVWTDLPEILEWEGNRWCGWLPTQVKMIYEIHKKIPVDAILLTSLRTPSHMEQEWKYLLFTENSLPLYRTVKVYKGRGLFAKLLIRDEKE
jgi:hypothetical protein